MTGPAPIPPGDTDRAAPNDAGLVAPGDADLVLAGDADLVLAGDADLVLAGDADLVLAGDADLVLAGDADLVLAGDADLVLAGDADLVLAGDADLVLAGDADLVAAAISARAAAYAPYSRFAVGAAVLTDDGRVVAGCNVENASYGLTVCAERVAIFSAVAGGARSIAAIAVVAQPAAPPCGACRQVIREFGPECRVLVADPTGVMALHSTIAQLLPHSFGPDNLPM